VHHLLQKAIEIAERAHAGQTDKAGKPYIGHPIRVMNAGQTLDEKIVGVLHDAVEDSDLTLETLAAQGFSVGVIAAVDAITKREGEEYEAYLQRVMSNELALRVKIADMTDNMNLSRIETPTEKDVARLEKYASVLPRLKAALQAFQR
jgi:(p)ppGpp synthase/HD superfamily hydrolase